MITSTDQLNREHSFAESPRRIVSLVPSITELLCDLGLRDRLVGCTKFCVRPANLKEEITIIGGTKNVKVLKVEALKPDLIIASKEENVKSQVDALEAICPVWVSDVTNVADAIVMIARLGELFGLTEKSKQVIAGNRSTLQALAKPNRGSALYLIWRDPYMSVGGDTYIHDLLEQLGYTNVCGAERRYPTIEAEEISLLRPDHILLSSEPYPFAQQHIEELQKLCPASNVELVDGEFFSWYGSRLMHLKVLK